MMFFKKSNSAQEIEASVLESLPQSEGDGIQAALQSLADSAEIFEAMNLPDEAEVITQFMETIASGQFAMVKEAKKKAKKKSKKKKSPELSSDKQVDNLAHIGWVFNAPKSDCGECSMADDDGPASGIQEISAENDNDIEHKPCHECRYDHALESEKALNYHFPSLLSEEESEEYRNTSIDMNNAADDPEKTGKFEEYTIYNESLPNLYDQCVCGHIRGDHRGDRNDFGCRHEKCNGRRWDSYNCLKFKIYTPLS